MRNHFALFYINKMIEAGAALSAALVVVLVAGLIYVIVMAIGYTKPSEVPKASLVVSNFKGVQTPAQNIISTDACASLAAEKRAPVAVYIPSMKVCTTFNTSEGLKLGPANSSMVVLSNTKLPEA